MIREPWFAAYERPGRTGRVAAELAARTPATVLDTVAEAMGDQL